MILQMKDLFIADILKEDKLNQKVVLFGWIKSIRHHSSIIFLDIVDSTGEIKCIFKEDGQKDLFEKVSGLNPESVVKIEGLFVKSTHNKREVVIKNLKIINPSKLNITPKPRDNFDIFNNRYADLILRQRHLYLRNPKLMAVFKSKDHILKTFREFFHKEKFIEVDTPILTQATLYGDKSTFDVDYFGTKVYLSQCAGLYLEALCNVFERVYTVTPAFRNEKSRSPRHNPEFWHIKGQVAFASLEDVMGLLEEVIYYVGKSLSRSCKEELEILETKIDVGRLKPPYPRISYDDAVKILNEKGKKFKWGKNLGPDEEKIISNKFKTPFFIVGIPRSLEPFPYQIDDDNPKITKTADLLAPDGFGEILGVAEFIYKSKNLIERMKEPTNNKLKDMKRLKWFCELKEIGCAPHSGFGMGIERVLRWLLNLNHIRDTFTFPRLYHRIPYP